MGLGDIIKNSIASLVNKPSASVQQPTVDVSQLYSQGSTDRATMEAYVQAQQQQQAKLDELYNNPAIGAMYHDQYYPNAAKGISAGTYSGKTFSAPLFVSQGLVPMARYDAMNKARYDADLEKAKKAALATQGIFEKAKPDEISDPAYQQAFNENFYAENDKFIQSYQQAYPENWAEMLQSSPEYNKFLSNSALMARSANTMISEIATLDAEVSAGKKVITPDTKKMIEEVKNGMYSFGGNPAAITSDLVGMRNRVQAEEALQYIVDSSTIMDKASPMIEDWVYDMQMKGKTDPSVINKEIQTSKSFNEFADQMADELMRGQLAGSKVYTKKQVKDFLLAYLGSEASVKFDSIQTGRMNEYQRQSAAQGWEQLKLQKQELEAKGDQQSLDLANRLEVVWNAKNGKSLGNAVGVSTSAGKVTDEKYVYVDPKDFQGWDKLSQEEKDAKWADPTFNNKYARIKSEIKADPTKYVGNTFVSAGVKQSGKPSNYFNFNTADPNFVGDYNNFINGNDPAATQIDNDLFKKTWNQTIYNTTSGSSSAGATQTTVDGLPIVSGQ